MLKQPSLKYLVLNILVLFTGTCAKLHLNTGTRLQNVNTFLIPRIFESRIIYAIAAMHEPQCTRGNIICHVLRLVDYGSSWIAAAPQLERFYTVPLKHSLPADCIFLVVVFINQIFSLKVGICVFA